MTLDPQTIVTGCLAATIALAFLVIIFHGVVLYENAMTGKFHRTCPNCLGLDTLAPRRDTPHLMQCDACFEKIRKIDVTWTYRESPLGKAIWWKRGFMFCVKITLANWFGFQMPSTMYVPKIYRCHGWHNDQAASWADGAAFACKIGLGKPHHHEEGEPQ